MDVKCWNGKKGTLNPLETADCDDNLYTVICACPACYYRFSSNFEAFALELLEDLEEMFPP